MVSNPDTTNVCTWEGQISEHVVDSESQHSHFFRERITNGREGGLAIWDWNQSSQYELVVSNKPADLWENVCVS